MQTPKSKAKSPETLTAFQLALFLLSLVVPGALVVDSVVPVHPEVFTSVTTITTVGYGDKYPITLEGRIIAGLLMLSGVGLFGTLSGLVASLFLGSRQEEKENPLDELLQRIRDIDERLKALAPTPPPPPTNQ